MDVLTFYFAADVSFFLSSPNARMIATKFVTFHGKPVYKIGSEIWPHPQNVRAKNIHILA